MFRVLEVALFIAIGLGSLIYLGNIVLKIARRPKSRLEREIDETLQKTREEDK